jgi:hypothetical protein
VPPVQPRHCARPFGPCSVAPGRTSTGNSPTSRGSQRDDRPQNVIPDDVEILQDLVVGSMVEAHRALTASTGRAEVAECPFPDVHPRWSADAPRVRFAAVQPN